MTTLSLLPVELIYHITSYLDECEVVYLLRTSKHFYSVLRRRVWSTFTIREHWADVCNYLAKLADLTREVGADVLGYQHIHKIEVLTPFPSFTKGQSMLSGFHEILLGLIEQGKIDLRHVYIRGNGRFAWPRCLLDDSERRVRKGDSQELFFLQRVKDYSWSKTIQELSMNVATSNLLTLVESDALNLSVLTKLTVEIDLGGVGCWNDSLGERCTSEAEEYLTKLPGIFAQTVELRELSFCTNILSWSTYDASWVRNERFPEWLRDLQIAFDNLKKLKVLKIGNDQYENRTCYQVFFHPSFFVRPPENCKVVEYCSTVSVAWWRLFASHPFTGVKSLKLNLRPLDPEATWWDGHESVTEIRRYLLKDDEESINGRVTGWDFRLNTVAVTGLKDFTVDMEHPQKRTKKHLDVNEKRGYPRDLIDCISQRNNCSVRIIGGESS
ncbi:hypothetical protein TWF481_005883 [Arthrobotrys musiformis]|uniref:F-box domain-containing protein n=1 Tax=Arthrobotrys musiformis TaxID=47236 RepID=A0AAV9WG11_9PEZI